MAGTGALKAMLCIQMHSHQGLDHLAHQAWLLKLQGTCLSSYMSIAWICAGQASRLT